MTPLPVSSPSRDPERFKDDILAKLTFAVGKDTKYADHRDWLIATSLAVRDRLVSRHMEIINALHGDQKTRS
jgi:starch phosphorylase